MGRGNLQNFKRVLRAVVRRLLPKFVNVLLVLAVSSSLRFDIATLVGMKDIFTNTKHLQKVTLLTYNYAYRITKRTNLMMSTTPTELLDKYWYDVDQKMIRTYLSSIPDITTVLTNTPNFLLRNRDEFNIRRVDYQDHIKIYSKIIVNWSAVFREVLIRTTLIVPTLNILHLHCLLIISQDHIGLKHLYQLIRSGSSYSDILANFKAYSEAAKRQARGLSRNLIELHALNGYMTLPNPDYNMRAAVEELANAGSVEHQFENYSWNRDFERSVFEMFPRENFNVRRLDDHYDIVQYREVERRVLNNLRDFILLGDWQLPGSANLGKVTYYVDDEPIVIKARKNMILDLFDNVDDLVDMCLNTVKQTSVTFPKNEFSKVRIVVGSDVLTTIKMKFLQQYFGIVVEELRGLSFRDTPDYFKRMVNSLRLHGDRGASMCSYDFKGFERQPTEFEMQVIYKRYADFVPDAHRNIVDNVLLGLQNHYLYYWDHNKKYELKQRAGVPSGIAWTTLLGGTWNIATFNTASAILGITPNDFRIAKGDDSVIANYDNLKTVVLVAATLELKIQANPAIFQLSAVDNDGHFHKRHNVAEFLRRSIATTNVTGYCNRSIVHLSEFKPWSREGDPVWGVVDGIVSALLTVGRRMNIESRRLLSIYSSLYYRKGINMLAEYGGYGLMIANKLIVLKKREMPKLSTRGTLSGARLQSYQMFYKQPISTFDYSQLYNDKIHQLLHVSDIPNYRQKYRSEIKKIVQQRDNQVVVHVKSRVNVSSGTRHNAHFASDASIKGIWEYYTTIQRFTLDKSYKAKDMLKRDHYRVWPKLDWLIRRFRFTLNQAIDWVSGDIPYLSKSVVSPNLTDKVKSIVAGSIAAYRGFANIRNVASKVAHVNSFLLHAERVVLDSVDSSYFQF